jgi:predicted phosphoribosyltransferase
LIVVRKIGHPQQPEYAVGAITEHGEMVLNPAEAGSLNPQWIEQAAIRELDEARRRREIFQARSRIHPEGKIAIVVDDGLATGLTMEAALRDLRKMHPARVIVAVPVAAAETVERLRSQADDVVALQVPSHFGAVGAFYKDFEQLTDADIVALLNSLERTA